MRSKRGGLKCRVIEVHSLLNCVEELTAIMQSDAYGLMCGIDAINVSCRSAMCPGPEGGFHAVPCELASLKSVIQRFTVRINQKKARIITRGDETPTW